MKSIILLLSLIAVAFGALALIGLWLCFGLSLLVNGGVSLEFTVDRTFWFSLLIAIGLLGANFIGKTYKGDD